MVNIWTIFISNFGGQPFESTKDHIISYRTILIAFVLEGMVCWMAYNAYLFSVLSVKVTKYPFNDLDSFSKTDYK